MLYLLQDEGAELPRLGRARPCQADPRQPLGSTATPSPWWSSWVTATAPTSARSDRRPRPAAEVAPQHLRIDPGPRARSRASGAAGRRRSHRRLTAGRIRLCRLVLGPASDDHLEGATAGQINAGTDALRLYAGNITDPAYNPTYRLPTSSTAPACEFQSDGSDPDDRSQLGHLAGQPGRLRAAALPSRADHRPEPRPPAARTSSRRRRRAPLRRRGSPDANGVVTVETGTEFADAKHVTLWGNWGRAAAGSTSRCHARGRPVAGHRGPLEPGSTTTSSSSIGLEEGHLEPDEHRPRSRRGARSSCPGRRRAASSPLMSPGREARRTSTVLNYIQHCVGGSRRAGVRVDATRTTTPIARRRIRSSTCSTAAARPRPTGWRWAAPSRSSTTTSSRGDIVPMVVVMGNGNGVNFHERAVSEAHPGDRGAVQHLLSRANAPSPASRWVSGLAMTRAVRHPGAVRATSAASRRSRTPPANANVAAINAGTKLLRIYSGDIQDFTYAKSRCT